MKRRVLLMKPFSLDSEETTGYEDTDEEDNNENI